MNAIQTTNTDLDVIFPEGKEVTIPRPGDVTEIITVMPLPLRKWKQGFKYIAEIAPLLGFDLFGGKLSLDEIKATSGEKLWNMAENMAADKLLEVPDDQPSVETAEPAAAQPDIDLEKLGQGLMGEGGDRIIEFMAFAIDKDVAFVGGLYDEAIDLLAAIIEVNLNFFIQKLLPKIMKNVQGMAVTAQNIKTAVQR